MSKVFFVAGLGYGDEGKGTMVEYLTHKHQAGLIVRYNGGAQAAHNVVFDARNGRWSHTYSQFGSGTHLGAKTFLSKFMLVDPGAIFKEASHLREVCSEGDPLSKLYIDREALLVTPYHKAANRFRELSLGNQRHGSCGMGIGEARMDAIRAEKKGEAGSILRINDLLNLKRLTEKLEELVRVKFDQLRFLSIGDSKDALKALDMLTTPVKDVAESMWRHADYLRIVDESFLRNEMHDHKTVIFEGAQGVLLDESYGFYPHTTWTNTTFANAQTLFNDNSPSDTEVERIGVTRSYMTRHGNGPLVTEDRELAPKESKSEHNGTGTWQGEFRVGHLDLVALKYSTQVLDGVDYLAMTHLDCLPKLSKVCVSYSRVSHRFSRDDGSLRFIPEMKNMPHIMEELTLGLEDVTPTYWPVNDALPTIAGSILGYPVRYLSSGPTLKDKKITD